MPVFLFTKQQRLLTPSAFKLVFDDTSFKVHQPNLLFFVKIQHTSNTSRLGLAITKKKVKKAHERNRLKRLTREYFRLHQERLLIGVDVVLIVKQDVSLLSNAEIVQQLSNGFAQIHQKLQKNLAKNT